MEIVDSNTFQLLAEHIGHKIVFVGYGENANPPWVNLAVECEDCGCVIVDWECDDES